MEASEILRNLARSAGISPVAARKFLESLIGSAGVAFDTSYPEVSSSGQEARESDSGIYGMPASALPLDLYKAGSGYRLEAGGISYTWSDDYSRIPIIREGVSYEALEVIASRLRLPTKAVLDLLGIPQTTYNKKKRERAVLSSRDSELVLLIIELLDYGLDVFNHEDAKFYRWFLKPNISLGGLAPFSYLDTITGIDEVRFCLHKIDYGIFA